jgi:phage minor structural protein
MRFKFFNQAGDILFERNDDETASVVHEEMSLQILYPYDENKVIQRGMLVGYTDVSGGWQVFEIRKAKLYEPDHYQEITAEHICIAELTDEHFKGAEWTNITASAALAELLDGTGWAVGTDTSEGVSSANVSMSNVWQDVRSIENNWNVYILPRVTVGTNGITGRYLDIIPAGGTWRGLRLSLEKNADELGVTWDDSKVKTALYAYGKSESTTVDGQKVSAPITFEDVVWEATADHPAKPAGQAYLVDPDATAAFGRNGRPRFGYYQNGDISDPEILLEKTWESLKTLNHPDVTIDSLVTDLYRLGYNDVPIRLHDMALTEIRPTGIILQLEIVQFTEDLNDPLQSRVTIGTYIPNIIYINRETKKAAGGGGGGGGGQNDGEFQDSLFVTNIQANELGLAVTSAELTEAKSTIVAQGAQLTIDRTGINSLAVGTGAQLNADGTLVVDSQGNPIFVNTGGGLYSKIEQNASAITLKVSKGDVATQLSVECGNVSITGGDLTVDGYVTTEGLSAEITNIGDLYVDSITAEDSIDCLNLSSRNLSVDNTVDCGDLVTDSITLGGSAFTSVIVDASVSGNTLTLTKDDGTTINFNKGGVITAITKSSQTWKPALFTHGGFEVGVYASGNNVGTYSDTIEVDGAYAWSAGWQEGYDDCESEFSHATVTPQGASETVFVRDNTNGTNYYQQSSTSYNRLGTSHQYTFYGTLYAPEGAGPSWVSKGYGTWYLWTGDHRNANLYQVGSSVTPCDTSTVIKIKSDTRYKEGTPDTTTYYTRASS